MCIRDSANTLAGPLPLTPTSATGVTPVVTGGLVLFPGLGSVVVAPTVALFVIVPLAGALTLTVTFDAASAPKVPSDQLTVPAPFVPLPLALTKTTFTGKRCV